MSTRTLTLEQMDRIRAHLRQIVDREFGGNQTDAAKALGLAQSQVNQVINGVARGVGLPTLLALADYEECSLDELLGRAPGGAEPRAAFPPALVAAIRGRDLRSSTFGALRARARDALAPRVTEAQWVAFVDALERASHYLELQARLEGAETPPAGPSEEEDVARLTAPQPPLIRHKKKRIVR